MSLKCNLTEVNKLDHLSPSAPPQNNIFPYQLIVGGHFRCGSSYFTARDCCQDSLLLYTCQGCGKITYRNAVYSLPAGTMILLDGKYAHRYATTGTEGWELIWMHYRDFSPVSIADYLFERNVIIQQIPLNEAKDFYRSLKELSAGAMQLELLQLSQLFSSFFTKWGTYNYNRQFPVPESREHLIHKAQGYIREYYASDLSLDELAARCSVSKYYLIKIFRETIGMTPYQYLLHVRIGHARVMLLSTSDSISSIGEAVGFSNTSSFIAAFRKLEGTTPLRVRLLGSCISGK